MHVHLWRELGAAHGTLYSGTLGQRPDRGPGEIAGRPGEVERVASG